MRAFWRRITFKWMAFSILLATIPFAIAGTKIIQSYQKYLRDSIIHLQREKAIRVVEKTRGYLEKATGKLLFVANDAPLLRWGMAHYIKDYFKHFLSNEGSLVELALLDKNGVERISVSKQQTEGRSAPKDESTSPVFLAASKGHVYYGGFHYNSEGKPLLVIGIPLRDSEEEPAWVLKGKVDLHPLIDLLRKMKIGEKGSTYVVDHEGYLIAATQDQRVLLGPFVDWVLAGREGSLEFEDLRGQKYLVVYEPIPELKWGVIVHLPLEEAYQPLREVTWTALKWIGIAFAFAFIFSFILTRRFTSPIQHLSREMTKVSRGNLEVHVEPSSKDEVGELTETFNRMVLDLKRSQEAVQEAEKKYRDLFENSKDMIYMTSKEGCFLDVNQAGVEMLGYSSKEELMEMEVQGIYQNPEERRRFQERIAEKGFVKDFEVRLKKRDGMLLDCLITATCRKDPDGNINGYEGVIKDITDRKRMEEELLQRTKELEALYELSRLVNQSPDLDQIVPLALEKVLSLTGFEMGTIYLVSEDGEWLELKYQWNYPPHLSETVKRLRKGEGVTGTAFERKEVVVFSVEEYPSSRILPHLIEERVRMLVGIPLLAKGEAIGGLCLTTREDRSFGGREIRMFQNIGNQIGMALEHAKLFTSISKAKSEWEATFDSVSDIISVKDPHLRILRGNRPFFHRYELNPQEVIGKTCHEVLYHREVPCEGCQVIQTFKTGRPSYREFESKELKGVFENFTFPVFDEAGRVVAVIDTMREVTEKKRLEKEKEVINNLSKILASSLDIREVFKAVHAELKQIFETHRMTVTLFEEDGKRFRFFLVDSDEEAGEFREGEVFPLEGTFFHKTAESGLPMMITNNEESEDWMGQKLAREGIHSLLIFPLEYKGRIFGALDFGARTVDHFTERHLNILQQIGPMLAISIQNALLLDAIRGSEEKYRRVVEGALDGVLVVGDDYRLQFVNESLSQILGYTKNELIGMDFRDLLDEESKKLVEDRYLRRQRGEEVPPRYEFNVVRKDGAIRHVEISANLMKGPKGQIHTIAFLKDITEQKKMEEQLLRAEKLRALGEMASGVAHDFNNALAAILGNTQFLLYTVKDEEVLESLRTIEKVAKDSSQTVKRLQEFTRRRTPEDLFKVDLNAVVRDVIEMTKPRWRDEAQRKGLQIEVGFETGEIPPVLAHASEMREVITNILLNAVEAMPEGGKIKIRTFRDSHKVYLQVTDTGTGMDEKVKQKIFEPFFTTKPFTNSGLGLSMSYGIIKRFGGEIEVETKLGSGTTFTIFLPISDGGQEEKEPDLIPAENRPARILVIDDEETVRNVLSKMLTQFRHRVAVAKDGEEGLRLFRGEKFDLVLTDLGMPGISGWEVCKRIKQFNPSVPVGMITGWGLEIDKQKREESGLDFVITKPFDFKQILQVVSDTIRGRTQDPPSSP